MEAAPSWPLTVLSLSPDHTFRLARELGALIGAERSGSPLDPPGTTLALLGELGSGKTVFTKGLAAGLGVRDPARVTSPTFVIRQDYEGRRGIHHYDVYRLGGPEELLALGFLEDLASGAVVVVEWADRVAPAIPPEALVVELEHAPPNGGPPGREPTDAGLRKITFRGDRARWSGAVRRAAGAAGSGSAG
jgi:tRNA threonylcarbamoyladenosine biosynthesis protein TsaE